MMTQRSSAAVRQGTYEVELVPTRQGTFDTDPEKTLRSKSGNNIKRGSIAIPVIDENSSRNSPRPGGPQNSDFVGVRVDSSVKAQGNANSGHSLAKEKRKNSESVKSTGVKNAQSDVKLSDSKTETTGVLKHKKSARSSEVGGVSNENVTVPSVTGTNQTQESKVKTGSDNINKESNRGINYDTVHSQNGNADNNTLTAKPGVKRTHSRNVVPNSKGHGHVSPPSLDLRGNLAKSGKSGSSEPSNSNQSNNTSVQPPSASTKTASNNLSEDPKHLPKKSSKNKSDKGDNMTTPGSRDDLTKYQPASNNAPYSTVLPYNGEQSFTSGMGKESYEAVYMERDTLLTAEAAYKKRIKQLEDELAQFLKNIEELREENIHLRTKVDELEGQNGQSKSTVVINTEVDELKREIGKLKTENNEYKVRTKDYISKQAHLSARNAELAEENEELRKRLNGLTIIDNDEDVETPRQEQEDIEDSSNLEEELSSVKSQLEETKSKENKLQNEVKKLKELEEKKKKEAKDLEDEKKQLQHELSQVKLRANEDARGKQEAQATELRELKAQVVSLQTENQEAKEEALRLKAETLEQVKVIHSLEKTIKSHEKAITDVETSKLKEVEDLKSSRAKLLSELNSIKQSNSGTDEKIKKLESENKTLTQQLAQKRSEVDELMSAFKGDHLEDQVDSLKEEVKRLKGDLSIKESDLQNMQESLADISILRSENKELKDNLEVMNNKLVDCQSTSKSLHAQKKALEDDKIELEKNLKELGKEKKQLQHDVEIFKENKSKEKETAETLSQKEKEVEDLRLRCSLLEKDIAQKKKEFTQDIEEIKTDLLQEKEHLQKELDVERGRKKEAVARLQRKYEELEEEKESITSLLKKENLEMQQKLSGMPDARKAEKEVKELSKELHSVYKKYSEITEELEQKNVLEQNMFEMTMKMEKLKTEVKLHEKEQKDWLILKDQLNEIEASNRRLTEENAQLKKIIDSKSVPKRIDFLEMKQHDADARVRQLEGWVEGLYDGDDGRYNVHMRKYSSNKHSRASRRGYGRNKLNQNSSDNFEFMRPTDNLRRRSYDDLMTIEDEMTQGSTPTLPSIHSVPSRVSVGYSQIHKRRIDNAPKRRH